jgi:hypothetical protein
MSTPKAKQATVRRKLLTGRKVPDGLSTLVNVCAAGAQCPEVQSSPLASQALTILHQTVTKAQGSLATKQALAQALMAAIKALSLDFEDVKVALGTYQVAVGAIANGDASVINKAGLLSRGPKSPSAALGMVSDVTSKPGKNPREAIINWPAAPGATGYALQVNYTPQDPNGLWTTLTSGSRRTRVVKGPVPGCQFLVQIAALGSDGTQSDWSDAILATAL